MNYNKIQLGNNEIKIATIDTMLTFYLAFYYTNQSYYYKDRIMCMIRFLFDVEQHNRLAQRGLLKRFSIDCYGKQPTLEFIRAEKMTKFKELKNNRNSREYEEWFLKYNPVAKYGELIDKQDVKTDLIRGVSKQSVRNKKPLRRTKRKRSKKTDFLDIFTGNQGSHLFL